MSSYSSLTKGLYAATSGMLVQSKRILLISENLANVGGRPAEKGQLPYKRRVMTFQKYFDKKLKADLVKVKKIKEDRAPLNKIYSPNDPAADDNGFILESNVKAMIEMADLQEAIHSHEANLRVFEKIVGMLQSTINLLRNN